MNILTLIIALIQMDGSDLTGNAWTDLFLNKMVGIEQWFLSLAWWVWGVAIAITIILLIAKFVFKKDILGGFGLITGCVSVLLLLWPLIEWVSVLIVSGMANNFSATAGVTNMVPFIIYLVLYLSVGVG